MRLTAEQIRQGLLHDDIGVRQHCLQYFTNVWTRDESVMPIVTQVIHARGPDAFDYFYDIERLPQSEATIEWLILSLRQAPELFEDRMTVDFRPGVLTHASGKLLQRYRDDILLVLPTDYLEFVNRRLRFLSESPAALWERLETRCAEYESGKSWLDYFPDDEADDLVTSLAELRCIPIDQMMTLLQPKVPEDEDSALKWLQPKLVLLAGLIRHEPVLPILIEKLRGDHDALSAASSTAMVRLGTDDVLRAIEICFLKEGWSWQLYATCALYINSDEAVRLAAALLQSDSPEENIRQRIACCLACQFSTEGLEAVGKYLDTRADWLHDTALTETLSATQATARLLQVDLPRFDHWQTQLSEATG